jgi:GAF domain-containing protein
MLDTPPEPAFDRIVALARIVSEASAAVFTLVDEHRQWFKAKSGVDDCEGPREYAFCAHAILSPRTTWVEDARADPRFSDNPSVTGAPWIRFYAGVPVVHRGRALGTICVFDPRPRSFDARLSQALELLALTASDHLEMRRLTETADQD